MLRRVQNFDVFTAFGVLLTIKTHSEENLEGSVSAPLILEDEDS